MIRIHSYSFGHPESFYLHTTLQRKSIKYVIPERSRHLLLLSPASPCNSKIMVQDRQLVSLYQQQYVNGDHLLLLHSPLHFLQFRVHGKSCFLQIQRFVLQPVPQPHLSSSLQPRQMSSKVDQTGFHPLSVAYQPQPLGSGGHSKVSDRPQIWPACGPRAEMSIKIAVQWDALSDCNCSKVPDKLLLANAE